MRENEIRTDKERKHRATKSFQSTFLSVHYDLTATNLILMLLASNINSLQSVNYLLTTAKLAIMWVAICLSARIFMFHLMFIRKTEEAE